MIKYKEIIGKRNLFKAFLNTRTKNRTKKRVHQSEITIGTIIQEVHQDLLDKTFVTTPHPPFIITVPKQRVIIAPSTKDNIVQHAIYQQLYPKIDKRFIYDSYGCRKGKGTHKASNQLQNYMRKSSSISWNIQIDIKGYYFNIQHKTLEKQLKHFIKDDDVIDLMMKFVNTDDPNSGKGLNVGNLLSQLYGLIYLNQFDHYVKRVLKVDKYIRYVDDMVFVGIEIKKEAERILQECIQYLEKHLGLTLSQFKITPMKKGLNFVGFRTWRSRKFVRKHSLNSFNKSLRLYRINSVISIMGHALGTSSHSYMMRRLYEKLGKGEIDDIKIHRVYQKWYYRIYFKHKHD